MEKNISSKAFRHFFLHFFIQLISSLVKVILACPANNELIIDINFYKNNNPIFDGNNVVAKINDLILMQAVIINNDDVDYSRLINLNHTWSIDFRIINTGSDPTLIYRPKHVGYVTIVVMISGTMQPTLKANKECSEDIEEFNGVAYDYLKVEESIDHLQWNATGKRQLSSKLLLKEKNNYQQTEWNFYRNKLILFLSYSLAIFFILIVIILFIVAIIRYWRSNSANNNEQAEFDRIILLEEF